MKLLITGGAGFIGSNLAKEALLRGHEVSILDDLSTGYIDNVQGLDVRFHRASILDTPQLDTAMSGCDSVVHLAALGSVPRSIKNPTATHDANATGTLCVLESARRNEVPHVIASSSSSVYGLNPALPKSEREWVRPMSPYAVSKLAAEQYLLAYQTSYNLRTLAFRFFNVYGPGQRPGHAYAAVIPVFLDCLFAGNPLPVNGDGTNSRDFTYVGTVCETLLSAVENRTSHPEPVNLAFGTNTSLNSLIAAIASVTDRTPKVNYGPPRPGDVPHSQADNTQLRALFPSVTPVALERGLRETAEWLATQHDRA